MIVAAGLGVRLHVAALVAAGYTACHAIHAVARRGATAVQVGCEATAQLSHCETAQLSHRCVRPATELTTRYSQHIEKTKDFPVIRRSFDWHAGCWLQGVGTQLDNGATHGRLCRRGILEGACGHVAQSAAGAAKERGKRA